MRLEKQLSEQEKLERQKCIFLSDILTYQDLLTVDINMTIFAAQMADSERKQKEH